MNGPTGNRSTVCWVGNCKVREKKIDKNLAEPDVAKKRITDSKEFFNYTNRSDSKKQNMW